MYDFKTLAELRAGRDKVGRINDSLAAGNEASLRRAQRVGASLLRQFPGLDKYDTKHLDAIIAKVGRLVDEQSGADAAVGGGNDASVGAFWAFARERLVNDLCAISCLYDVYARRCARLGFAEDEVVERPVFANELERLVEADETWASPRVGGKRFRAEMHSWVLEAEPVVLEELAVARRGQVSLTSDEVPYGDLTQWLPPFVSGSGKKCTGVVIRRDAWERYQRLGMPPWAYITRQDVYVDPEKPDLEATQFYKRRDVQLEWYAAQTRQVASFVDLWREA